MIKLLALQTLITLELYTLEIITWKEFEGTKLNYKFKVFKALYDEIISAIRAIAKYHCPFDWKTTIKPTISY